jgi:ribonuclease P protein component
MIQKTGESFSRSSRLTSAADFQPVFKENFRISDDCFTILVSRKKGSCARLGFAIAKKQLKRAVDRNRIKRLIRESFRKKLKDLPDHDVVVMVRFKILSLTNPEIFSRLSKHWSSVQKKCENC